MSIYCIKCGVQAAENAIFCGACGVKIHKENPQSSGKVIIDGPKTVEVAESNTTVEIEQSVVGDSGKHVTTRTLSTGDEVQWSTVQGVIVSSEKSESVRIHQSREILPGGGSRPGQISSSVDSKHNIWIRTSNGEEYDYDMSGINLPIREGHVLKFTNVCSVGAANTRRIRIDNLTTKEFYIESYYGMASVGHDSDVWNIDGISRGKDYRWVYMRATSIALVIYLLFSLSMGISMRNGFMLGLIEFITTIITTIIGLMIGMSLLCIIIYLVVNMMGLTPSAQRRRKMMLEISNITANAT